MDNLGTYINGRIFAENSQMLLRFFIDIIFSWRFLIAIILFFILKYLYFFIKWHAVLLFKQKIKINKKIQTLFLLTENDIKNIIYGWIGCFFTWTIVDLFLNILPLWWYNVNWLNNYNNILISSQQIEFAKAIHQFMGYFALIEVILIWSAFLMLIFSFLWWVFKTASKLTGALAIILYALSIFISSYTAIVIAITDKN